MNNCEKMQKLADTLNEAGNKHHPNHKWVVVSYNDMPGIDPDIWLVGEHEESYIGVDEDTCKGIQESLDLSGLHSINDHIGKDFKGLVVDSRPADNGEIVTVETMGYLTVTPEDIEKIGADYAKHAETLLGKLTPKKNLKKLANRLNKFSGSIHPGYAFDVNRDAALCLFTNDDTCEKETSPDNILKKFENIMEALLLSFEHVEQIDDCGNKEKVSNIIHKKKKGMNYQIHLKDGCFLNDDTIGKISVAYYKQIQKVLAFGTLTSEIIKMKMEGPSECRSN